jgi:DNA-binding transcriptional LysR family regulator
MSPLNCHQLLVFASVARLGSFSSAAKELLISQPAVSNQVKLLEQRYGEPLFERHSRGIRLTRTGELMFDYARRIFALSDEMEEMLRDLRGLTSGRITIGASTTIGEYVMPATLAQFEDLYPGVTIELRIFNTEHIASDVLGNELDIGFVGGDVDPTHLIVEPFAVDEIVLIASPDHRLARKRVVRPADLLNEGFVAREKGSATRIAAEARLRELGIEPKICMELGGNESVKRAVGAGSGLGMLSRSSIRGEEEWGQLLVLRMPEFRCYRQFSLIYRKDKRFTSAERAFLDLIREH